MDAKYLGSNNSDANICLIDSITTHIIVKNKNIFYLKMGETNINTISDSAKLIENFRKTTLPLPQETKIIINNALLSPKSRKNLSNFKNICENEYHI